MNMETIKFKLKTSNNIFSERFTEESGKLIGIYGDGSLGFLEFVVLYKNKIIKICEDNILEIGGFKICQE